jgi:hypothetical protein
LLEWGNIKNDFAMKKKNDKNPSRENRIMNEIIVDCRDEAEENMSWYYYLEDNLNFPFTAEISIEKRNGSKSAAVVVVLRLAGDETTGTDLRAGVCYQDIIMEVPLLKLRKVKADKNTIEALEDWRYWNSR